VSLTSTTCKNRTCDLKRLHPDYERGATFDSKSRVRFDSKPRGDIRVQISAVRHGMKTLATGGPVRNTQTIQTIPKKTSGDK